MDSKLNIQNQNFGIISYLIMSGGMTEDNELNTLTTTNDIVVINAKEIYHLNSCGVRDWIHWIHNLKGNTYLIECSTIFMMQLNMLEDFIGEAAVVNFFVPYFCPCCNDEKDHLVNIEEAKAQNIAPPFCENCKQAMKLDVLEETYFTFLESQKDISISNEILQEIANLPSTTDQKSGS